MRLRLLGPVEVFDGDRPASVGGPKQRLLLTVLALQHPRTVTASTLIDALWPEDPPPTATKSLQVFVARLRKALGPGIVVTRAGGYALELDATDIDVRRFEALAQEARGAAGDRAGALIDEALALWRGPALGELAAEPAVAGEARRLEELRLALVEHRVDVDLAAGLHTELVGRLEALVAEAPLRERLRAQLMLALYRSGRQAEALAAYQAARRVMVDEFGLEPDPELRRLQARILAQDPELAAPTRRSAATSAQAERSTPASASRRPAVGFAAVAIGVIAVAVLVAGFRTSGSSEPAEASVSPDSVMVLDAISGRLTDRITAGSAPVAVAAGAGAVWVASAGEYTVERIDPRRRRVSGRIGIAHLPSTLTFGGGALWVGSAAADRGTVSRLEPAAATVATRSRFSTAAEGDDFAPHTPTSLAVAGEAVWGNRGRGSLIAVPVEGGSPATLRLGPRHSADGLVAGAGALWLASSASDRVLRIDPGTRLITAVIPIAGHRGARVAGPYRLAAGAGAIWVTNAIADTVSRIDPRLQAVTSTTRVGRRPTEVVAGPEGVWVLNAGEGTVMRLDPRSGEVTVRVAVPGATGLALADSRLWVTVAGGRAGGQRHRPGSARPVASRNCSPPWPAGSPGDVAVVSDLPTWLGGRRAPVVRDMRAAIRRVLASHGHRGGPHRILYQECDDSDRRERTTSVSRCAENARAYAREPSLVGVLGPYHSFCATVALPVLNAAAGGPVAMLSPSNTYAGLTRAGPATAADEPDRFYPTRVRSYFRTVASDERQGEALARLMRDLGVRRVFLLDDAHGTGYAVTRYVRESAAELGLQVAGQASWPDGPDGLPQLVTRVLRGRPDAVLLAGCFCTGGYEVLARLKHDLGPGVRYFGSDAMAAPHDAFPRPHPAADGLWLLFAGRAAESARPAEAELLRDIGPGRPPESFEHYVLEAAAAAEALVDAIGRSDGSRGGVIEALRTTRLGRGVAAGLGFDASGDPVAPVFSAYQVRKNADLQPLRESAGHVFERLVRVK